MADNPFNIDSLNSVNFDADALRGITSYNQNPENGGSFGGSAVLPNSLSSITQNPGNITVISNAYTAGRTNSYEYYGYQISNYYLPTFGSVQFDGIVDGGGNPITFWVHGFSENGLLLMDQQDVRWPTSGGGFSTPAGEQPEVFVFGMYGVTQFQEPQLPGGVHVPGTVFDKEPVVFHPVYCFAEGTKIATADGPVAVEDLSIGEMAVTASGSQRPIKWIGQLAARPARHPRPHEVNPVCVRAHAFGQDMPRRDLRLSPGHAVFVDGVLVPVCNLVNGATIVQETVEKVRYFHVELDGHDVLLAEGLPCESYLDDGNRSSAINATEFTQLYGRLDPKSWDDACAPLVAEGPQVTAIQQRLLARAEALGWHLCEEADLWFEANGVEIQAVRQEGNRWWFHVPATDVVTLRSGSAVLAHVMPGVSELRRLGVALSELRIECEATDLEGKGFGTGFHAVERHENLAWRWSDGAGVIALGDRGACTIELAVAMVAPTWRRTAAAHLSIAA